MDISFAELEIGDDRLPDLESASNNDKAPDVIPHNLDAVATYYNYIIFVPQTIHNYNSPILGNSNEIRTSDFYSGFTYSMLQMLRVLIAITFIWMTTYLQMMKI